MDSSLPPPRSGKNPDVTVIVVNYNTAHLLKRMFGALSAARGTLELQVIVVDNASRDNSIQVLRETCPSAEIIENSINVGFARANNQALATVRGRYVLLLNTDAFVSPDTLSKTVGFMENHPRCGVLGVKLIGQDGSLQPSCRYFPTPWNVFLNSTGLKRVFPGARLVDDPFWNPATLAECDWVPGCYYLVRREVIERIGLFDSRYFLYCEEVDHCRAVRQAGWSVIYYPCTQVIHIGGESAVSEGPVTASGRQISHLQIESQLLYFRKHHGVIGVLAAMALAALGDFMEVSKLVLYQDIARAARAIRHTWTMLKVLVATGLGSHATR